MLHNGNQSLSHHCVHILLQTRLRKFWLISRSVNYFCVFLKKLNLRELRSIQTHNEQYLLQRKRQLKGSWKHMIRQWTMNNESGPRSQVSRYTIVMIECKDPGEFCRVRAMDIIDICVISYCNHVLLPRERATFQRFTMIYNYTIKAWSFRFCLGLTLVRYIGCGSFWVLHFIRRFSWSWTSKL